MGTIMAGGEAHVAEASAGVSRREVAKAVAGVLKECPGGCSGRGKCHAKSMSCFCYLGWVGSSCSVERYTGYMLSFYGGQHVELPPMGYHNSITLEMWVRPVVGGQTAALRSDMPTPDSKEGDLPRGGVRLEMQAGVMALTVAGNSPPTVRFTKAAPLPAGKWSHIAVAYSKRHSNRTGTGSATLYVGGRPVDVKEFKTSGAALLGASWLGGRPLPKGEGPPPTAAVAPLPLGFKGNMDEVRIWGRALSPSQVKEHTLRRLQGGGLQPLKNLLGYFLLDEGSGRTALDSAAKTIAGGSSWSKSSSSSSIGGTAGTAAPFRQAVGQPGRPEMDCDVDSSVPCDKKSYGAMGPGGSAGSFFSSARADKDRGTSSNFLRLDGVLGPLGTAPIWEYSTAPFAPCGGARPDGCGTHGKCTPAPRIADTRCTCDKGYGGPYCQHLLCQSNCSNHGVCSPYKPPQPSDFLSSGSAEGESAKEWPIGLAGTYGGMKTVRGQVARATLATGAANRSMGQAVGLVKKAVAAALKGELWACVCEAGWTGVDCTTPDCPRNCSGPTQGLCGKGGACVCKAGFMGPDCGLLACPGDSLCSHNGQCVNGTCVCDAGWTGGDCSFSNVCPHACSKRGLCVDGECQCPPRYTGEDCSWSSGCWNFCSGRGKCVRDRCVCDALYTGRDCSQPRCPGDCSGHGDCLRGICVCEAGWGGLGCSRRASLPLRCRTIRRGMKSVTECSRGDNTAVDDAQVVKLQFSTQPGKEGSVEHRHGAQPFTDG